MKWGLKQAWFQIALVTKAESINEIIHNSKVSDTIKAKILLIQQIKKYAEDSIGLKKTSNYSTYIDLHNKPVLWVVTACPTYSLDAYQWNYPIFGKAAYKGFFKIQDAKIEAKKLKKLGFDAKISEVAGWSTLGILSDPILSSMLENDEGELANLIIHELTHSTFYLKNNVVLNENLATLVGFYGARNFLIQKYGKNSPQLKGYENSYSDRDLLVNHLFRGAKKLDSLYKNMKAKTDYLNKSKQKYELIYSIIKNIDTIKFANRKQYEKFHKRTVLPNNTFFSDLRVYNQKNTELSQILNVKFHGNLQLFLTDIRKKYSNSK